MYGLEQSPRVWFGRFTQAMQKYEYHHRQSDHTLFFKHALKGKITVLILYVDDIVVTHKDSEEVSKLKIYLAAKFEIKDLDILRYFLGIEVGRLKWGIFISLRKYILDLHHWIVGL